MPKVVVTETAEIDRESLLVLRERQQVGRSMRAKTTPESRLHRIRSEFEARDPSSPSPTSPPDLQLHHLAHISCVAVVYLYNL